jgi:CBS domain-containing protein/sporulation protein YlmC with PRC-barrel domain
MAEEILYFTELLGLKVYDLKNRVLGRVRDAALMPALHASRIDRYLIGLGKGAAWVCFSHEQVAEISLDGIRLRDEQLVPYHSDEWMLRMKRDLVDQQIIDAHGRKVVRVNDVTFEIRREQDHDTLHVLDVDIGMRSVLRRVLQGAVSPRFVRRIQTFIDSNSIDWKLCNILEPDAQRRLRLNISTTLLEKMHPADLADIVEELSPEDREALIGSLDPEAAAEALSEVASDIQTKIFESLDSEKAAEILEVMDPDEAADVLAELGKDTSGEILQEMSGEEKADVEELLEYDEDTAGGLMTTDYLAVPESASVAETLAAMRANPELAEAIHTVFLIDSDERIRGAATLPQLILAEPASPVRALASEPLIFAAAELKAKRVFELFDKYNLLTLPVVDEEGRLSGVVTADDVISALREK